MERTECLVVGCCILELAVIVLDDRPIKRKLEKI
jgi:hypothetical protein